MLHTCLIFSGGETWWWEIWACEIRWFGPIPAISVLNDDKTPARSRGNIIEGTHLPQLAGAQADAETGRRRAEHVEPSAA